MQVFTLHFLKKLNKKVSVASGSGDRAEIHK